MEFISRSFNQTIYLVAAILITVFISIALPFMGVYSLGIIFVAVGIIALIKIKLNANTAFLLTSLLLYVNVLRPFNSYKVISSLLDVFVILLLIKYLLVRGIEKQKSLLFFVVTLFIFLSFLQMFNPNIPGLTAGLQGFRKTAIPFLLFYIGLFAFKDTDEVKKFIVSVSIISIPILVYGIKQYLFISDFDKLFLYSNAADIYTGMLFGRPRATSIFAGSFHFGMFGAALAVLNLYLMDNAQTFKQKILFFVLFFLSILACYSSLTRTNLLALIIAILGYKIMQFGVRKILIFLPLVSLFLVSAISIITDNAQRLMFSNNEFLRMIGTIVSFREDTRLLGRTEGWETVLELVKKEPILAFGTGSAGDTLNSIYNFQYHVTSHNFFLKILMETGFLGLLLIGLFFIIALSRILRTITSEINKSAKNIYICCLSLMIVFLVNSLVGSTIETYPVSNIILLFMGICVNKLKQSTI